MTLYSLLTAELVGLLHSQAASTERSNERPTERPTELPTERPTELPTELANSPITANYIVHGELWL